jgi:glutamate--cysteine ligase
MMMANAAIWAGLLYDKGARRAAWELTQKWSFGQLVDFQGDVARRALRAQGPNGEAARDLAREVLALARQGLKSTQFADDKHLDPLFDIVETGRTLADRALEVMRASPGDPLAAVRFWQIA